MGVGGSGIPLSRVVGELKAQRKLVGSAKSLGESSRQQVAQSGPGGSLVSVTRTPCRGQQGSGQDADSRSDSAPSGPWALGKAFPSRVAVAKNPLPAQEM